MFVIGSHLSISKGYLHMGKEATKIGGNTFQYFTRNPRGGSMRALDVEDMNNLSIYMKEHNFGTLLAMHRILITHVQPKRIYALLRSNL